MNPSAKGVATMPPQNLLPTVTPEGHTLPPVDSRPGIGPVRLTVAGQDLTIYVETGPALQAMLDDIRSAQKRIWLESYIFLSDTAGKAVDEALKERARAGVEVRLLCDAIGSQTTHASFFGQLQRAGVQVHLFHSLWEVFWKFASLRLLNHRDHRKLLVIDDRLAYFGGMNIVDVSSAVAARAEHLPLSAGWRDVHVRLEGPQQAEIAESFDRSWRRAKGESVPHRSRAYQQAHLAEGEEHIQFFDSGPGLRHTRAGRLFTRLIEQARSSITLSIAYFLPVGRVLRALFRVRKRGVLVRVVVPGDSDVPLVQYAARHLYTRLLRRRFHIHERQGSMLHSKVMIVDNEWTVIGSANLDARSLWINLEFIAVIRSRKLAHVMNEIVAYEMAHSKRVTLREFREQSWWRRLRNRLAWALRWWL
jgi:cardiolipin synthase A/B